MSEHRSIGLAMFAELNHFKRKVNRYKKFFDAMIGVRDSGISSAYERALKYEEILDKYEESLSDYD